MGCRLPHNYSPALLKHSWLSYQRDAVSTNINLFYLQNGVLILLFSRNRSLSVRDNKTLLIFLFIIIYSKKKHQCVTAVLWVYFSAFYFYVFSQNFVTEQERKTYIASCVNAGDKKILITEYPYRGYVWLETPYSKYTDEIFKQYYHIPTYTYLKVISYDEWKTAKQNIN